MKLHLIATLTLSVPGLLATHLPCESGRLESRRFQPVDLSLAGTASRDMSIIKFGSSINVSFCPVLACVYSPGDSKQSTPSFFDHQRASALFQAFTSDDGHSEEQNIAVVTTISTGFSTPYSANTIYSKGDNITIGNAVYRAIVGGRSGLHSAPPGSRPTAAQTGNYTISDGSVTWAWINDAAINAKLGAYFEANVVPGAGAAWGAAFNYHFTAPPRAGNFFPGVEIDYANDSGEPCRIGVTDCTALRLAMSGSPVTEGIQVTGNATGEFSSIWGLRLNGDKLASQSAIEVDAAVPIGLSFGGSGIGGQSHAIATIQDVTSSPASLLISGRHPRGAIVDQSTSENGILLSGSYHNAQLEGRNFSVRPDGSVQIGSSLTIRPDPTHKATIAYEKAEIGLRIQSMHSGAPTPVLLNPMGGLVQAGPGGFAGKLTTPRSSSAPCQEGQFADDANYHYVCVATNKWKRVALSSF